MTDRITRLVWLLLLALCLGLAAWLQPRSLAWRGPRAQADTMLQVLLGDGRRMFANHFFTKADVYLHGGYYPSIFDQATLHCEGHLAGTAPAHDHAVAGQTNAPAADEHEAEAHDFLGQPKDWLDAFGRKFRITEHTHLEKDGTEREILPWLRLSAELDPQQVETYTVAAYWLRTKLGKAAEAREFLRDGWRANPDSYEILFELGRLYYESEQDATRARNLWELALHKWHRRERSKAEPDQFALEQLLTSLARLEEHAGDFAKAIEYSRQLKAVSPRPDLIEQQIEDLRQMQQKAARPPNRPTR